MDVTSLYSNIDHEIKISCVKKFLDNNQEIPEAHEQFLLDAITFLENNFFTYNNETYQQCKGKAMGTRMAPSYANLFIGALEEELIWDNTQYQSNIVLYRRFFNEEN